ncbi:hypothetical protein G1H11_12025 [Phytoactinopolyspora alkaliphila]|uniref:Uncharacterized protein n=1 Tax=Phytoactinopolyspora alkaliphila TaxID=1783498 RepID=A0A6N9YM78_9ACTN|nr:hypothetical protein [Phytoactinopolyspora alkaliphila]NED96037.1 hypothetical protein [Phytoactinopolyspora alkaliphila]
MSKSMSPFRRRRTQKSAADHPQERSPHTQAELADDELELVLASQDRLLMAEAQAAEQHAELRYALDCVQHMSKQPDGRWASQIAEMIELGDAAEPWHWARLTVAAASRWITAMPMPLVARTQREIAAAAEGAEGSMVPEFPGWVAGRAAMPFAIADYVLFDHLMIEVFLVQWAPALAERAGGGRSWAETPGVVYELAGVDGVELQVRSRRDGSLRSVRHFSELVGLSPGDLVYGRLIEVPGDPGLMFAAPPIVVDDVVAQRLSRPSADDELLGEPFESRCASLGAAVRSGSGCRRNEPTASECVPPLRRIPTDAAVHADRA